MKRSLVAVALTAALAAPCSGAALRVVTTTSDLASITATIAGDRASVVAIAKGYQNPHFVDPKPSFLVELRRADLLIAVGLELEVGWLPALLQQCRNPKLLTAAGYLDASLSAEILERPAERVTRAQGDVHPFGNPHYWLDPENGRAIARAIAAKLSALDPDGAQSYAANLAGFESRLNTKLQEWEARLAPFAGAKIVAYHNSWPNFFKRFRLFAAGFIEPKPGIPPSPTHTIEIINLIAEEKIKVILVEPYFDTKTPDFIAAKTGSRVLVFYPSVGGIPAITDYLGLIDYNVSALAAALGGLR